jgi:hypothetical protein
VPIRRSILVDDFGKMKIGRDRGSASSSTAYCNVDPLILIAEGFADFIDSGVGREAEILFDISQLRVCSYVSEFRIVLSEGARSRIAALSPQGPLFGSGVLI